MTQNNTYLRLISLRRNLFHIERAMAALEKLRKLRSAGSAK